MTLRSDCQIIKYIIEECQGKATPVDIVMHLQAKELFSLCHKFASGQLDDLLVKHENITIVNFQYPGMPTRIKRMYFVGVVEIQSRIIS